MRINREITSDKVVLIGHDGMKIGLVSTREALGMARDMNLDLVEMRVDDGVPLCKIVDYGKVLYDKSKKQKKVKNKEKEIQIKTTTASWDEKTKVNNCLDFLNKGYSVRVKCSSRGRVVSAADSAQQKMKGFVTAIQEAMTVNVHFVSGYIPNTEINPDVREVICVLQRKTK